MKNALLGIGLLLFAIGCTNFSIFKNPNKLVAISLIAVGIIAIAASSFLKKTE